MQFLQKHKSKIITIVIIIIAIIASGYYSLSKVQESKDQLLDLKRMTVEKHDIQKIISASGKVISKSNNNVFAPVSGQVKELKVEENQTVEIDDIIAIIETTDTKGETHEIEVKAPIKGTITKSSVQIKQPVILGQTVMFTINDLEDLEIMSMLSESDITKISNTQKVMIEIPALDDLEAEGDVIFISLSPIELDTTSPNYKVSIDLKETPDNLRLGMSIDLAFIIEEKENVIAISDIYIFSENEMDFVKVYKKVNENIEIIETEVKLGIEGEALVEIVSGINEGDEIVLPTENIPSTEIRMPFMNNFSDDEQ